jgi:hypothetical protein
MSTTLKPVATVSDGTAELRELRRRVQELESAVRRARHSERQLLSLLAAHEEAARIAWRSWGRRPSPADGGGHTARRRRAVRADSIVDLMT